MNGIRRLYVNTCMIALLYRLPAVSTQTIRRSGYSGDLLEPATIVASLICYRCVRHLGHE